MAACDKISCLTKHSCGPDKILSLGVKEHYGDGAIYMPYAELNIGDKKITLGNKSSPPINHAAISSMQIGFTGKTPSWGAEIEIIDHAGTMYPEILKALNKTVANSKEDSNYVTFDYGWVVKKCDGTTDTILYSKIHNMVISGNIIKVTPNIEGNNAKIKVELSHSGARWHEAPLREPTIGTEDNKVTLKEAIKKIFTEYDPKFRNVVFRDKDGNEDVFTDGVANPFFSTASLINNSPQTSTKSGLKFEKNPPDGPKAAWPINQKCSLSAVRSWLNEHRSVNKNGFVIYIDPHKDRQSIVIQEDVPMKNACGSGCGFGTYKGTFIVNGGKCSSVIKFTPVFQWTLGVMPGSGAVNGGANSGKNDIEASQPSSETGIQKAGTKSSPTVSEATKQFNTPENAGEDMIKGWRANVQSNIAFEIPYSNVLEGTLEIIGNPYFGNPVSESENAYVSIIVINPFRVKQESNKNCVWAISTTNCNELLSNKSYQIKGISHLINSGSYTTTLEVMLSGPNVDKPADSELGCGGETFTDGVVGLSEAKEVKI